METRDTNGIACFHDEFCCAKHRSAVSAGEASRQPFYGGKTRLYPTSGSSYLQENILTRRYNSCPHPCAELKDTLKDTIEYTVGSCIFGILKGSALKRCLEDGRGFRGRKELLVAKVSSFP